MARAAGASTSAPEYDEDLYSDEFIRDPWPRYARMRALGPVVWLPRLGNFALTRHAAVAAALRDHDTFISGRGVAANAYANGISLGSTPSSDGERHATLRQATSAPLLPGALEKIRSRLEQESESLIDRLSGRGVFDAMAELAPHLPLMIVRDLVGLPDFGKDNMLRWASAAFDVLGSRNERGRAAVETFKEQRAYMEVHARPEEFRPGSWSWRLYELVREGRLAPELAPVGMRDYLTPSLDTTIAATGQLIYQLGRHPEQWRLLRERPELARNAANEAVRMASPVRSFARHTSRAVEIEGVEIPAGARVMMLYASASRDERVFENPDEFDITRHPRDHLGFGSGIHMCMGQHLAQLEMVSLLQAMLPRVREIAVGTPEIQLNNTIYSFSSLPVALVPETGAATAETAVLAASERRADETRALPARVLSRRMLARGIVGLEIGAADGAALPPWDPGAHIDVHVSDDLIRQYSLTGRPEEGVYRIAVKLEPESRGGSRAMHGIRAGEELAVSPPKNLFPLESDRDSRFVLFSGGIGITPMLAMAWHLHERGGDFVWHLSARDLDHLAWGRELRSLPFASRIRTHLSGAGTRLSPRDFATLAARDEVYVCGPRGYMDFVRAQAGERGVPPGRVHLEHFGAEIDVVGDPFEVVALRSGRTITVGAEQTIVAALRDAGIPVETACENGVCGTCITRVVDGRPEHRDMVLTEAEKASNTRITVCCSRSQTPRLSLDL